MMVAVALISATTISAAPQEKKEAVKKECTKDAKKEGCAKDTTKACCKKDAKKACCDKKAAEEKK